MKQAVTLLFFCILALCSQQLYGMMPCMASDSTQFKACLSSNATDIQIKADFTVHLTGFSLEGVTINIGSNTLTITGNPSLDSTTVFNTSGAAGALIIITPGGTYMFKENTVHGGIDLDFLNSTLVFPLYVENLYEAITQAMILPVTWGPFSANLNQEAVVLEWATAAELNNERFIVETSTEGEVFTRIGEIAGAGTTTEPHTYQFAHQTPSAGVNYYRLKQVDFDGSIAYSKVIAINAAGNDKIFAFPNPVQDQLYIQYDLSKGPAALFLFDAMGRQINTTVGGYAGYYEAQLPGDLPPGTYWLRVIRSGKVQTLPIVKQ